MFLMLASSSTNNCQKTPKIPQFSTKNTKKPPKITQFSRVPLKIAFVTRTSEIFSGKAEGQNRRRHSQAISRTLFGLTTPPEEIAAVRSKNEFLEVPFSPKRSHLKTKIKYFKNFYLLFR
jgi:hypothetical protein